MRRQTRKSKKVLVVLYEEEQSIIRAAMKLDRYASQNEIIRRAIRAMTV